jgi:hypothetical protein
MIKPAWDTHMFRTCLARTSCIIKLLLFLVIWPFTFHVVSIWISIGFSEWCHGGVSELLLHSGLPTCRLEVVAPDRKHARLQPCFCLRKVSYHNTYIPGYEVLPHKRTLRCVVHDSDCFPLNCMKKFSRPPL